MAKVQHITNSLAAGELSPRFLGRADMAQYHAGCKRQRNFITFRLGGVIRRSGFRFVGKGRKPSGNIRVERFQFSVEQTYTLEFGAQYIRFFRDEGQLIDTFPIAQANTGTNQFLLVGDQTDHIGAGDEFEVEVSTGNDGLYTATTVTYDGGTNRTIITPSPAVADNTNDGNILVPTTISSPYSSGEIFELKFVQSADILYITHPDHPMYELRRTEGSDADGDTWVLRIFRFADGPYLPVNTDTSITVQPAATSGTGITVTASEPIFSADDASSDFDARQIRISNPASGANWGWARIRTFVSATEVTVDIERDFDTTNATADWRLGAWSHTDGFPTVAVIHQERLWAAGTRTYPQTLWASIVSIFRTWHDTNFSGNTADDLGLDFTISSTEVNAIRWMLPHVQGLMIFTSGGEWIGKPQSAFDAITAANFKINRISRYGVSDTAAPTPVGNSVLFVTPSGREVREMAYRFDVDQFVAPPISLLGEHLLWSGAYGVAYQAEPHSVLWLVRNSGQLTGITYEREHELIAMHEHVTGGIGGAGGTIARTESVTVIRHENREQLWAVNRRFINGETTKYIEFMEEDFEATVSPLQLTTALTDAFFVDSGLTYDSTPVDAIAGLGHLEGEEVLVLGDGISLGLIEVTDGEIALDDEYSTVQVGLPYRYTLENMPMIPADRLQMALANIGKVYIRFHESLGGEIGEPDNTLTSEEIAREPLALAEEDGESLFTDIKELHLRSRTKRDTTFRVTGETPYPMTVLQIVAELDTGSQ